MDLKVKDIAELLEISEEKVLELVKTGKIPYYKIKEDFFFNPVEIEEIIIQKKISFKELEKKLNRKIGYQTFSLFRAIYKGDVITIEANSKEEVIQRSVDLIAKKLDLVTDFLKDLLLDREKLMTTAIGDGIAIPHPREFRLNKPFDFIFLVFTKEPVDYQALDGKKVDKFFFFFSSQDKRHLHLLGKIAHLARDKKMLDFLSSKPSKKEILENIKNWEKNLIL